MQIIYSDDPKAIEKLQQKIDYLEARAKAMKQANKDFKNSPNKDAHLHYEHAYNIKIWGVPYPAWAFTNNGATLRATKKRLQKLLGEKK